MESSLDRVEIWLRDSPDPAFAASPHRPPTPQKSPAATSPHPLKRRRGVVDMEDSSSRSSSPSKRQRQNDDDLVRQSTSGPGSVALSDRTVLTAPGSAKRSTSPSRHLIELRTARPSISLSEIGMPPPLPEDFKMRLGKLRQRLDSTLKGAYIPGGLKEAIEQDPVFQLSLSMDPIDTEAFDNDDRRTLADFALVDTLQQVKSIFQNAALCAKFLRDENAWCFGVIWPLMELAIKLYGKKKWRSESVQSQSINPLYLSRILDPSMPTKERPLLRKTDFCFSYSYLDPHFRSLYDRLEEARLMHVSHTTDNFTSRALLFSGIEVKPLNGDQTEAELQMSIWMAASLRKKMELARKAFPETVVSESDPVPPPSPTALLEPGLITIGHEHKIYYACPSSASGDEKITILGPDRKFAGLSTSTVQGIFKLAKFYGGILEYGYETEEESEGLWGQFLARIIEKLA